MVFKGLIDCSSNPSYPAADRGHTYRVSVAGKIGGAAGINVEAGDMLICTADGTAAGNQAAVGNSWGAIQANLDGALLTTAIGVTVQGYDATLAALAALATAADRMIYATGLDTFSTTPLTAFARTLLDDADAAAARATLGVAEPASQQQAEDGNENTKFSTPLRVFQALRSAAANATEVLRGTLRIGTQAEVDAGALDNVAVTPKKLSAGVVFSISANGYLFLPSWIGGFGIQWGSSASNTVTFPLAFPSAVYGVLTQEQGNPAGTQDNGVTDLSQTGFRFTQGNNSFYWFAWGK